MVPSVVNLEMVKTFALPLAARMSKAFFSFQEESHEKSMYYTEVHGGLAMAATSVPLHCCRETFPSARLGEQAQLLPRLAQPLASSLCQFHSSSRRYKWKMKKKKKKELFHSPVSVRLGVAWEWGMKTWLGKGASKVNCCQTDRQGGSPGGQALLPDLHCAFPACNFVSAGCHRLMCL